MFPLFYLYGSDITLESLSLCMRCLFICASQSARQQLDMPVARNILAIEAAVNCKQQQHAPAPTRTYLLQEFYDSLVISKLCLLVFFEPVGQKTTYEKYIVSLMRLTTCFCRTLFCINFRSGRGQLVTVILIVEAGINYGLLIRASSERCETAEGRIHHTHQIARYERPTDLYS